MSTPPQHNLQRPPVSSISPAPIDPTNRGELAHQLELKQAEIDRLKLLNQELADNIRHRRSWGKKIFWLLVAWLAVDTLIVSAQGFNIAAFHLDDSIVIAFIGTTTANVLGLGYIVANYLFPKPPATS